MTLVTYRPGFTFDGLLGSIDKLFHDDACAEAPAAVWTPPVDIIEEPESYLLRIEVPGVPKEDIEINLDEGVLTIKGEKKTDSTDTERRIHTNERVFGGFARSFHLPKTADGEQIKASFKNGILELLIPKRKESLPKKVEITTE